LEISANPDRFEIPLARLFNRRLDMTHHEHFAKLSDADLQRVQELEKEIGTVLIAYDKAEVMKTSTEPVKEISR
jgi:hypothetical protein